MLNFKPNEKHLERHWVALRTKEVKQLGLGRTAARVTVVFSVDRLTHLVSVFQHDGSNDSASATLCIFGTHPDLMCRTEIKESCVSPLGGSGKGNWLRSCTEMLGR